MRQENEKVLFRQMNEEKLKREAEFWHKNYDYILKRANDLGVETLRKFVTSEDRRHLSRREQTDPYHWDKLSASAVDSDNSLKHSEFQHPLLRAKQKALLQNKIPFKKNGVKKHKEED